MELYTDRQGEKEDEQPKEYLTDVIWHGILGLYDKLVANNNLAKEFPEQCPDGNGICGCNVSALLDRINALIPKLPGFNTRSSYFVFQLNEYAPFFDNPGDREKIDSENKEKLEEYRRKEKIGTYAIFDFIELLYEYITDVENGPYHPFFRHYELEFPNTNNEKEKFRNDVNYIFQRNNLIYRLNENGEIERILDPVSTMLINNTSANEETLSKLLQEAKSGIIKPKFEDRYAALKSLWDAFERMKTLSEGKDKKDSIKNLLNKVSVENSGFYGVINEEGYKLSVLGNDFQIRHFEKGKHPIETTEQVDYFFFRMLSYMNLILPYCEKI